MSTIVIKRDGRRVPFDFTRIYNAVAKAMDTPDDSICSKVVTYVVAHLPKKKVTVEAIQDLVEQALVELKQYHIAKNYILYRNKRTQARDLNSTLNKTIHDLIEVDAKELDSKRENANIDGNAPMGIMLEFGSEIAKKYSLDNLINPEVAQAHKKGLLHIHDLSFYPLTFNCCQIPAGKFLKRGFHTGHGYIREPNSITTAAALMCIIIQSNQNSMMGGQSVPMFEYDLAPYVAKSYIKHILNLVEYEGIDCNKEDLKEALNYLYENKDTLIEEDIELDNWEKIHKEALKLTINETQQAMEALIHNLNTMQSRAGAQTPFSSINYGTGTTPEQRLIIKSILEATDKGLGNGETPIFPVQVFKLMAGKNKNKEDPNYDLFELSCKVSAKRLFPNYVFLDSSYNKQYIKEGHPETELAVMGCFSRGHYIKLLDLNTYKVINAEIGDFVENYDYKKYRVWDTLSEGYVEILNVINNPETSNFYKVYYDQKFVVTVTEDHYFPIVGKGRTNIRDLQRGDQLYRSNSSIFATVTKVIKLTNFTAKSYCLETSSDRFDINNIVSNNCRTRVISNVYDPSHEISVGRGNIAFTSINLPRIGISSAGDITHFYNQLDKALELAYTSLIDRFNFLKTKHVYNFPFLMTEGVWLGSENLESNDTIEEVLKQGTLSIGFIGLAECLKALIGAHHGESQEAQNLGLEIVRHMREYCDKAAERTGLNFSLFATPAEGLSGRFIKMDKEKFGVITGVTDKDYYSNSTHIPVYYNISAHKKIELEAPYHELCNAGHIAYVEAEGDISKNIEAFKSIILYMDKNNMTYGSINHPVDRCPVCGYVGIINDTCPKCGRHEAEAVSIEKLRSIGCNC